MLSLNRRKLLMGLGASLAGLRSGTASAATSGLTQGLKFGDARTFSFDLLKSQAKTLAARPYARPATPAAGIIRGIDFDKVQKIRFRSEDALWRGQAGMPYPISFFHLNKYSLEPVRIFALEATKARELLYSSAYFDYGESGIDPAALGTLGFSGFRANDSQDNQSDWLAFQGASYFRSVGQDDQYGASARGIAINTGLSIPEEFPRFSQFWLTEAGETLTIYALLEGPSVSGAYRFDCMRHGVVVMDVYCELFFRGPVGGLGIAPLTSMYWYGENQRDHAPDWRPEIHDNDGLAIWTGKGERIWRPLINPPALQTNSFIDSAPKGFGLMQRDRDFADYQDDSAFYNKRPGIWVEPKSDWGAGSVQLVEIPTNDEVHDNIVAFWQPEKPVKSGDMLSFDYRLYWQDAEPGYPGDLARVVSTRIGRAGIPGAETWPADSRKFALDFEGGALAGMGVRFDIMPVVTTSGGAVTGAYATKLVGTNRWRALFDVPVSGKQPIDLRCYLRLGDKTLSETWIYQYFA
ncbi:MAG TPA: glucan biosynthesis protein [Rhizomicrobium sp.]|nr:glucan biosynthesis protein [Rhizomicrobium sp.]